MADTQQGGYGQGTADAGRDDRMAKMIDDADASDKKHPDKPLTKSLMKQYKAMPKQSRKKSAKQ